MPRTRNRFNGVSALKKIDASQVEVLDRTGESLTPKSAGEGTFHWGGVRIIRGGPAAWLILPVLLPLILVLFFVLLVPLMIFGRKMPWPKR